MAYPDSNSDYDQVVTSKAPYIIICNGRIATLASESLVGRIIAVSQAAADVITFYDLAIGRRLLVEDVKPISDLQHELMCYMDNRFGYTTDIQQKVSKLFELLDELEEKYKSKV